MNGSVPLTRQEPGPFYDRQDFARHVDDDLIGISIGEKAGERTTARHAIAPRIVYDDEIDTSGFFALGG